MSFCSFMDAEWMLNGRKEKYHLQKKKESQRPAELFEFFPPVLLIFSCVWMRLDEQRRTVPGSGMAN